MGVRCNTEFVRPFPGCDPCGFERSFGESEFAQLLRLDFRTATIQAKPTIAGITALGVPTPTRNYFLTEAAVPFSDGADGVQNFTQEITPAQLLRQRSMLGLSADGVAVQSYTGVEFVGASLVSNSTGRLEVAGNAYLNVGAAGSGSVVAVGVVFRTGQAAAVTTNNGIVGKRDSATTIGWNGGINNLRLRLVADDGPTVISLLTGVANSYGDGAWHFVIYRVRRQGAPNDLTEIITPYEHVTSDISALGNLDNVQEFYLGGIVGLQAAPNTLQVNQLIVWEGANAAALTLAHAQTMFRHAMDPTGLLTTYTRAGFACDPIGYEAGFGTLVGCFTGTSGGGRTAQVDQGFNASFAHASGRGLRCNLAVQNLVIQSDNFTDASWVKTNVAVSNLFADLVDGPGKWRNTERIAATANNGLIEATIATVAATEYTQSIFLRSGTGGNVPARLIQQNVALGAENAGVNIVITPEWQRFDLTATTAVGQVSTGWRLRIDVNGDVIHAALANFVLGRPTQLVQTRGAAVTMPATDIRAVSVAGAWARGDQGEIDIYATTDIAIETYIRRLFVARTGATDNNARIMTITVGQQTSANVDDNAAVVIDTIQSAVYDHSVPFTERLLWRTPAPPVVAPNFLDALVSNGILVTGGITPWAATDTVDTWHIGQSAGAVGQLNGLIALIDSWLPPRVNLPAWP